MCLSGKDNWHTGLKKKQFFVDKNVLNDSQKMKKKHKSSNKRLYSMSQIEAYIYFY